MVNQTYSDSVIVRYWIYVAQGAFLIVLNGLIVATVLFHRILREKKEYALPAALAFCDAMEGLGAFLAGWGRNVYIIGGVADVLVSRWECLFKPWNLAWMFSEHTGDTTLLAISVDRLIAVAFPLFHYGLSRSYGLLLVACAWGPGLLALPFSVYLTSKFRYPEKEQLCFSYWVYEDTYGHVNSLLRIIFSTASVLLYLVIITIYTMHNKVQPGQPRDVKRYVNTQRKMTITLGISCLFTTIFYIVPVVVRSLLEFFGTGYSSLAADFIPYSYIWENVNRLANIFLYTFRHRNLRIGVKYLLQRKQLTANTATSAAPTNHNNNNEMKLFTVQQKMEGPPFHNLAFQHTRKTSPVQPRRVSMPEIKM